MFSSIATEGDRLPSSGAGGRLV